MRPSIENIRGMASMTQMFRWELHLIKPPSFLIANGVDSEGLNIRCETADLPKITNTPAEVNIRGHKVKYPGISNYTNALALTFVETTDNMVNNFLRNWREAVWETITGKQLPKSELEATIKIIRLDGQDVPIWEYTLFGCYLEDYEPGGTLDGSTSDPLKPVLTVSYDYFKDGVPSA